MVERFYWNYDYRRLASLRAAMLMNAAVIYAIITCSSARGASGIGGNI